MEVQQLAQQYGIKADTVRYYVRIGLLTPAKAENGYHVFSREDQKRLRFIRSARDLGFTQAMQQLVTRMEDAIQSWQVLPDCQPCGDHICHLIEGHHEE